MKKTIASLIILGTTSAFATGGIDCKSVDGTLELYTTEARAEGDNVLNMGIKAPWIQKNDIKFERNKDEVRVTREEGTVYMASNSKGQSITLVFNSHKRAGIDVSTAYIKSSKGVEVETVSCESN